MITDVMGKRTARQYYKWLYVVICVVVIAWLSIPNSQAQTGCVSGACVAVGPRLVSIDTTEAELLNPLIQALLPGTSVNLTAVDWTSIAATDINLNALITQLQTDLVLSSPAEVLDAEVTLAQLQAAMITVLEADGATAAANALDLLPLDIPGLTGTIQLIELLDIDLPTGSLSDIDLHLLDLITGQIQLYNFENVLTTPSPVTIDTGALGLSGLANVELWLQVVEPPVYICSETGGQFYTAAVRLKANIEVVDGLDLSGAITAINNLGLGVANLDLTQSTVLELQVYADIARAEGTITGVDAVSQVVNLSVEPGLVDLYVGDIPDATFFNRAQILSPALFDPLEITSLNLDFSFVLLPIPLTTVDVTVPLSITAFAAAEGDPGVENLILSGPFPETVIVDSGLVSAGNLVVDLLNDLDVDVSAGTVTATILGVPVSAGVLTDIINDFVDPIVTGIESTLQTAAEDVLDPAFDTLLGGILDPLLDLLGISIGQAVITVEGIARECVALLELTKALVPDTDDGLFDLSISLGGGVEDSVPGVGHGGSTSAIITVPGETYDLAEVASGPTLLADYNTAWECRDQDDALLDSGTGATFTFDAPAVSADPVTVTCTLINTLRQANLTLTKSDGVDTYTPGGTSTYIITLSNAGPENVVGASVSDTLPNGVTLSASWTCTISVGTGSCPASGGSGGDSSLSVTVDLDADSTAQITVPVSFSSDSVDYQ